MRFYCNIAVLWLVFLWTCLVSPLALGAMAPQNRCWEIASVGYDVASTEATLGYGRSVEPAFGYDCTTDQRVGEENRAFDGKCPILEQLVELFAAEGTVMRNVVEFQGMEVRAVRDLSHLDQGTLEGMQEVGFAPRTVNGEQISLHHLNQNPAGPLVEMPRGNNLVGNTVQHPFGNTAGAGLTDAQRAAYNAWRTDYWKWRATQELNLRRVLGN